MNNKGEILHFAITQGNVEDREPLKNQSFVKALKGKLYADKAYISQELTFRTWMMGKLHYKPYLRTDCLFILSEKTNSQIPTCQKLKGTSKNQLTDH